MPCVQRQKPSQELVCPPPSVHPLGRLVALMPIIQDFGHVPSGGMHTCLIRWDAFVPQLLGGSETCELLQCGLFLQEASHPYTCVVPRCFSQPPPHASCGS